MLCDSFHTTFVYSLCVMSLMWSGCPRPMVYPFLIYSLYIVCLMICAARRCLVPPPPPSLVYPFLVYSLLARKRVCCRPAMDVRRAGPDQHVSPVLIPATTCRCRPRGSRTGDHASVDVLTCSRRDSAGGTPIRRGSAGAKHNTIYDCIRTVD